MEQIRVNRWRKTEEEKPHPSFFATDSDSLTLRCVPLHAAVCVDSVGSTDASLPPSVRRHTDGADEIATITAARLPSRGIGGQTGADAEALRKEREAADFANYFHSYAEIDHQKQMLEDSRCVHVCVRSMCTSLDCMCLHMPAHSEIVLLPVVRT